MAKHPDLKLMIVPHEPTEEAIRHNQAQASKHGLRTELFSKLIKDRRIKPQVVIVDVIGVLADLYALGWAAYVGGGFGKGVHSVIEPAAHRLPVLFGENHHVSHEASLLLQTGGGFVINNETEFEAVLSKWLDDHEVYQQAAEAADTVVKSREGATERLLEWLKPVLG